MPSYSYYLIRTDGGFQTDAEAAAYVNDKGERLQPKAKAGDLKFVDVCEQRWQNRRRQL